MDIIGVTRYFNEFFYRLLFVNASKMIGRLMLKACHIILEVDYLLQNFYRNIYFFETIDLKNINLKKSFYLSFRVETDPADHDHGQGEIIDYVKVPENLEPGYFTKLLKSFQMQCSINCLSINREYILGFRWDCKCSPQVYRKLFKISFTT